MLSRVAPSIHGVAGTRSPTTSTRHWTGYGATIVQVPTSQPWGLWETIAIDPDGNTFDTDLV